jgi:pimeloyl-ACP methyl ester carboxylesterase
VSHLILYGAYTRGKLRRNLSPAQEEEIMALIQLIKVGWGKENPVFRQVYTSLFMPEGTPEQHAWFNELQRISSSPETAARIVTGFGKIDVRQLATSVSAPTLILHATGDARVPFDEGRLAASLIPGARFIPLESKNHLLIETEPAWEQFLEEVESFLSEDTLNTSKETAIKPNMITNAV